MTLKNTLTARIRGSADGTLEGASCSTSPSAGRYRRGGGSLASPARARGGFWGANQRGKTGASVSEIPAGAITAAAKAIEEAIEYWDGLDRPPGTGQGGA